MAATSISWCDEVWNPVTGCKRVSAGCDHCFAFALHDQRYAANKDAARIRGLEERDTPAPPFPAQYDVPFSKVQLLPDRLDQPLHWKKPRRVFVNSMGDLFHEDVPLPFIASVFSVMEAASRHTFLVLTKRPERMQWAVGKVYAGLELVDVSTPPPNVWLGVSVENQDTADERIPLLLQTPAAVRWISAEPLLGPVDLAAELSADWRCSKCAMRQRYDHVVCVQCGDRPAWPMPHAPTLDWVVAGGESGPHFREMDHAWAKQIHDQCREAGVAYFGKQDSGRRPGIELLGELGEREWPR